MASHLPIVQFEDKIMKTVEDNAVVVIIGETGSGKSTQLSQMLHRRGYTKSGIIAVTQPRRVAAVSVARSQQQLLTNFFVCLLTLLLLTKLVRMVL
jgi:ATP-dependent RNA helicase DHX8/PRP22